jgi:hypothetical protein
MGEGNRMVFCVWNPWVFICEITLDMDGKIVVDDKGNIKYAQPKTESDFLHWGKDS